MLDAELLSIFKRIQIKLKAAPNASLMATNSTSPSPFLEKAAFGTPYQDLQVFVDQRCHCGVESLLPCSYRGVATKYGLSPAILRTCKQMYKEASDVLHNDNAFIVSIIRLEHD